MATKNMKPIVLKGHTRPLTQVKFNKDGDLVFSVAKDDIICAWYSINGERLGTYHGHQGAIWSVDIDPKSEFLISAGSDSTCRLWQVETGVELFKWVQKSPIKRVEFSPDYTKFFIISDHVMGEKGKVSVFNINFENPSNQQAEPILEIVNELSNTDKVTIATWSYGSKYLICGHDNGKISKYDATTGELLQIEQIFKKTITDMQTSEDRSYVIIASKDESAKILDIDTFQILKNYKSESAVNAACVTPVKDFIILGGGQDAKEVTTTTGGEGKFDAKIFHKIFEDEICNIKGHFGPINCLAIHPNGTSYVSGGEDGYIRLHHFPKNYFDFQYEVEKTAAAQANSTVSI